MCVSHLSSDSDSDADELCFALPSPACDSARVRCCLGPHLSTFLPLVAPCAGTRNCIITTVAAIGMHSASLMEHGAYSTFFGSALVTHPDASILGEITPWRSASFSPPAVFDTRVFRSVTGVCDEAMAMLAVAGTFMSLGTAQYVFQLRELGPALQLRPLRKLWMASHSLGAFHRPTPSSPPRSQ